MNSSSEAPTSSLLLGLPAELRLSVYGYLPWSDLLSLQVCNSKLCSDVLPALNQRGTLMIARRKREFGKNAYQRSLRTLETLVSDSHIQIRSVTVCMPYKSGNRMKTFPDALEAFLTVIARLRQIDVRQLNIAITFPKYRRSDIVDFQTAFERALSLLPAKGESQGLFCHKFILCCPDTWNKRHCSICKYIEDSLKSHLKASKSRLEEFVVLIPEETGSPYWRSTGKTKDFWNMILKNVSHLFRSRILVYDDLEEDTGSKETWEHSCFSAPIEQEILVEDNEQSGN